MRRSKEFENVTVDLMSGLLSLYHRDPEATLEFAQICLDGVEELEQHLGKPTVQVKQ